MKFLLKIVRALAGVAIASTSAGALTSCDSAIYDDLDPCPQGLELRFVYDYNMEFANAFPSQVSCLTVEIYDGEGRYVTTRTETGPELADENWRMPVDLDPGRYTVVAYGGLECGEASFALGSVPASGSLLGDLSVALKPAMLSAPDGTQLHHLFYGRLDVEIEATDTERRSATVSMIKDTNNLRILLQNVDGTPVDDADFDYSITTSNTLMGWDNTLLPSPVATYLPWARGQAEAGTTADGASPAVLAYAEFSTGRFVNGNPATLTVTSRADGHTVLSIPLVNYLLLLKSQEFGSMGSQEFLDRESRWNMIFFLDSSGHWLSATIVINDWIVRINEAEL